MRTPRAEPRPAVLLALLAVAATAVLVATRTHHGPPTLGAPPTGSAWRGLVGSRPRVLLSEREIVVLKTPSLAERVAAAGGVVGTARERGWTKSALAAQKLLLSRLALQGIRLRVDHSFTRVVDGFSALVNASTIPLIERDQDVQGVYPVRVAYPASISSHVLTSSDFGPGSGHRPDVGVSGIDGRGVTIALLDTGVDASVPYLRGRVLRGIDLVGGDPGAGAAPRPDDPSQLEQHGTEMAGLLVGGGGPAGLSGVATGASVLPIRVAGWQPNAVARFAIYARSDQIIAGLERAVDPNGDGDAHDAARIALVTLAEPFAAFADGPEAQAAAGALALDTLVVAPSGNDGSTAAGYGDVSGPGGAPAALTVGAADTRVTTDRIRVHVRSGLSTLAAGTSPLAGAVRPSHPLELPVAVPRGVARRSPSPTDYFSRRGYSLVAGRAALVPAGVSPARAVEAAAAAGAAAVLLYGGGTQLPAGGLGLDDAVPVPVVPVGPGTAHAILASLARGRPVTVALRGAPAAANPELGRVAAFSSSGLAFDARVKPDLVAPGIGLATSEPGADGEGLPRFATVNGSSAAAATAAGAAALLAQARPALGADALEGLLVGTARRLDADPVTSQGAGLLDVGQAVAGEVAASPATLALGRSTGAGWRVKASFSLTNLSTRRLRLSVSIQTQNEGAAAVDFALRPDRLSLAPGHSILVRLGAITASAPVGAATADGSVVVAVDGGGGIRVPWAIAFGPPNVDLLDRVALSSRSFKASDFAPALLSLDAGRVLDVGGKVELRPVRRLDVALYTAEGTFVGVLARLRDLLPGRYTFGITGRGPDGQLLPPGRYEVRIVAMPVDPVLPSRRKLRFTLR